jgi:hypothetical protein
MSMLNQAVFGRAVRADCCVKATSLGFFVVFIP